MGRLGFPDGEDALTNENYLSVAYLRDFFLNKNEPFYSHQILEYMLQQTSTGDWLVDPTEGYQKYAAGCNDEGLLITNDGEDSFSLNTAMGYWTTEHKQEGFTKEGRKLNMYSLEGLRYEGSETFPNGLVMVVKTNQIPYGRGAWPAIWLLGTPDEHSWRNRNGIPSTWPFQGTGEIDFFETVDGNYSFHPFQPKDEKYDSYRFQTLHTPPSCIATMTSPIGQNSKKVECNRGSPSENVQRNSVSNCTGSDTTGCQNNGCLLEIDAGKDFKKKNMTFVFEYSAEKKRVRTYSFETDPEHDTLLSQVLESEGHISNSSHTQLMKASGKANGEHLLFGDTCDGVFQNMHIIVNTAVCGAWAGGGISMENTCNQAVRDDFLSQFFPDGTWGSGLVPNVNSKNSIEYTDPNHLHFWNITTPAAKTYRFGFNSFQYKSL